MHRTRLLVGLTAAALAFTGWTSTAAVAAGSTEDTPGGVTGLSDLGDVIALADSTRDDPGVRVAVVTDANGAAAGGMGISTVRSAPDQLGELGDALADVPGVLSVEVDRRVTALDDPFVSQQYALTRIRADLVGNVASGDGVVVAVIDTGVLGSHPDLATPLSGNRPRVLKGTTLLTPEPGTRDLSGTRGNVDPNGHGTHVAGIIAAAKGNEVGGAGLAPDAQILPVRALDSSGFGWSSDVAKAILWARSQGADVINLSLAGPMRSAAVSAAIDQVTTDTSMGRAPSIVVAGAGNSATNYSKMWPAAHSRVIAVAATDGFDNVASFSSRGSYVDVAAPGVQIVSTCTTSTYCARSGTSMASPVVAAVAALLRQQDRRRSGPEVRSILENTAHDIDAAGRDDATGWGRIDAAAALDPAHFTKVPRPAGLPTGSYDSLEVVGRTVIVRGRANDPDGPPIVRVDSSVDGKRSVRDMWAVDDTFAMGWDDVPGQHRVCVTMLDTPSRATAFLGCRDAVVK